MATFWCVNFDCEPVLRHGLSRNSWLLQYQYAHGGYDFQGYKNQKGRTSRILSVVRDIEPGDWLVAYLGRKAEHLPSKFYAIGKVRKPRQPESRTGVKLHEDSIKRTISEKSHKFLDGIVRYQDAPAFYDDFTDAWSLPAPKHHIAKQPKVWRYPQRIDVEDWKHLVAEGVPVDGLSKAAKFPEYRQAAFRISEDFFGEVTRRLLAAETGTSKEKSVGGLSDDEADTRSVSSESSEFIPKGGDERALIERQIRERRGQQQFRNALRKRYGDHCLVTGCKVLAVLEAAHIKPYQGEKDNHSENGLLLRADIHTLFDLNLLGIEPKSLRVELHPSLADSAAYTNLDGKTLRCHGKQQPSKVALKLRYKQFKERLGLSS